MPIGCFCNKMRVDIKEIHGLSRNDALRGGGGGGGRSSSSSSSSSSNGSIMVLVVMLMITVMIIRLDHHLLYAQSTATKSNTES
jgi:hypothetical protein